MTMKPRVIAVDFDGTLCDNRWPEIGKANRHIINLLIRHQAEGGKVILWTCRCGEMLDQAVMWCMNHGLRFDAINDNLPENIALYGNNCRKVWADEYWDDKSVIVYAGDHPSVLNKSDNGGYIARSWARQKLTIVRVPLLVRLRNWMLRRKRA